MLSTHVVAHAQGSMASGWGDDQLSCEYSRGKRHRDPVIGRSFVSRGIDLYILCLFKIYIFTYSRKAKQDVHIKFKRGTCFSSQAKFGSGTWSFARIGEYQLSNKN